MGSVSYDTEPTLVSQGGYYMKNKKLLLIIVPVVCVLIAAIVIGIILNKDNADTPNTPVEQTTDTSYTPINFKESDVKSAVFSQNFGPDIYITDKSDMAVLIKCIGKVRENNKHQIPDLLMAPSLYDIEFTFLDGTVETYSYKTYISTVESTPFKEFFQLESVIKQNDSIFSVDLSYTSKVIVRYTNRTDRSIMLEYEITDKAAIEEILAIGQKDALINKEYIETGCYLSFYNCDINPKCVSSHRITENAYRLDYLCDKYPEFKQVIELARKYGFK